MPGEALTPEHLGRKAHQYLGNMTDQISRGMSSLMGNADDDDDKGRSRSAPTRSIQGQEMPSIQLTRRYVNYRDSLGDMLQSVLICRMMQLL